jgi:PadR family transcriptional regulator, regulatory protein PadR
MAGKTPTSDLLQGTLDLLILQTLREGANHGWAISQRIQERSKGVLEVNQGSLYPALHRLELRGALESEWSTSENNRRAKFYRLTRAGRAALSTEMAGWRRYVGAVEAVLEPVNEIAPEAR